MVLLRFAICSLLVACGSSSTPATSMESSPAGSSPAETSNVWELDNDVPGQLFGNSKGLRGSLVAVRSASDPTLQNRYLLRATGTSSEFDGAVVLVERTQSDSALTFKGLLQGQPNLILRSYPGMSDWNFGGYAATDRDDATVSYTHLTLPTIYSV